MYPFLSLIRLIIGGQDGSVTFLVVAHNTTPEQLDESRTILRRLPSRKRQKRHYDEDNKENKVSKVRFGIIAGLSMGDDIAGPLTLVWVCCLWPFVLIFAQPT